jgi:hypothetical protein
MDGRSCTTAPELIRFPRLPRRSSPEVLCRLLSKQIMKLHTSH